MSTALDRCVGDVGRFLTEHWSRAPLHCASEEETTAGFADLLCLDDVDRIVSSLPRSPALRLVRDGTPLETARWTRTTSIGGRQVTGVGDAGLIWREFAAGATIVLQSLHRSWPPLAGFCRDLELQLTHPAQANAYVTPPSARGLAVHHDTHDVFVLQLAGRKQWAVHPPVFELPLRSQPWTADMGPLRAPLLEVELGPGHSMYIPRGFPHSARAQDGVSAHVTVGVTAWTGDDVVRGVLAGSAEVLELRRALPVGFADDQEILADAVAGAVEQLRTLLDKVDPTEVAGRMTRRFWATRPAQLTGHLRQLELLDSIDDSTSVRRRPGAVCQKRVEAGQLVMVLADRTVRMPARIEPALSLLVARSPLTVGHLAPFLDAESRLVLVRRLVREGLLEVVEPG